MLLCVFVCVCATQGGTEADPCSLLLPASFHSRETCVISFVPSSPISRSLPTLSKKSSAKDDDGATDDDATRALKRTKAHAFDLVQRLGRDDCASQLTIFLKGLQSPLDVTAFGRSLVTAAASFGPRSFADDFFDKVGREREMGEDGTKERTHVSRE